MPIAIDHHHYQNHILSKHEDENIEEGRGDNKFKKLNSTFQYTPNDGVFSNMTAIPEKMNLPTEEKGKSKTEEPPPSYESTASYNWPTRANILEDRTPNTYYDHIYLPTIQEWELNGGGGDGLPGVEDIVINNSPLGGYKTLVLFAICSVIFDWYGVIIMSAISLSHASRDGTLIGMGLLIIWYGYGLGDQILRGNPSLFTSNESQIAGWSMFLILVGTIISIFSMSHYYGRRKDAIMHWESLTDEERGIGRPTSIPIPPMETRSPIITRKKKNKRRNRRAGSLSDGGEGDISILPR